MAKDKVVLVASDGSPAGREALAAAIELAAREGDRVVVLSVWRHPGGSFVPRAELGAELETMERELACSVAEAGLAEARRAGVPAQAMIRDGEPAGVICAAADEVGARLVVVGTHGYGPIVESTLGSVSAEVLRLASVPVLVVPAAREAPAPA